MLGISPDIGMTNFDQGKGISPRDVVFILFRRRWVVLAVSIPIILLGGTSLFRQSGSFTASAKVLVELQKVDLPSWNATGRVVDYDRELSTLNTIAMSYPVAQMAAVALHDSLEEIRSRDPNLVDLEEGSDFVSFLLDGIDVAAVGESNVLEFRFTSANPRISLMVVGALRDAFVEYQIHGRKDKKAVAFYSEQMHGVRTQIDSLLAQRGRILIKGQYITLTRDLDYESGHLADLRSQFADVVVDRQTVGSKYNQLTAYLTKDPREFPIGLDESRCQTLMYWRNQVSEHDDQLSRMLTVYTPESDVVMRQKGLIQESLDQLTREEVGYVQSIGVELQSLKEKEEALGGQISQVLAKAKTAPILYQKVSLIDTEIASLRKLLDDIQGKLGEVRLSEFADERVSTVTSLTNPELSSLLSGGKTIIYFVLLVVFSIALGIVIAFILEGLDHRVYDPRDVEDNLKLPVFASVTKVK